ncbi:MAG: O-antigen ligase family protein [Bacteroidota bacterium]
MELKQNQTWFYGIGIAYIILNAIALSFGFEWLAVLPVVALILLAAIFRSDLLILFLSFIIPLSIEFDSIGGGLGISLPDEPLLMLLTSTVIFKYIIDGNYDYRIFKQPITIAIFINTAWLLFDCAFSDHVWVSIKFVIARIWYITTFYFLAVVLFKNIKNIHAFIWLHIAGLFIVIVYTFVQHSQYDFAQIVSFTIMQPFYVGHGVYAAAIAFFIPYLFLNLLYAYRLKISPWLLSVTGVMLMAFILGVIFSYTRAAWLSLAAGFGLLCLIWIKIKFRFLLAAFIAVLLVVYINSDEIIYRLSDNKQNSAEGFDRHLESVSNINNDVSNLERVNRYVAALNMNKERPWLGFGPGTFSFAYGVYQEPEFETEITTYFGDVGASHNEYLGPLAESGWPGLLTFLFIIYLVYSVGYKIIFKTNNIEVKIIAISTLVGLFTYLIHGLLNSYSETDKIAIILWGSFAIITALNQYHFQSSDEVDNSPSLSN